MAFEQKKKPNAPLVSGAASAFAPPLKALFVFGGATPSGALSNDMHVLRTSCVGLRWIALQQQQQQQKKHACMHVTH